MDNLKKIIKNMRKRAKDLREDTLVSITESVANEIMAMELEQWASKLEDMASGSGQA